MKHILVIGWLGRQPQWTVFAAALALIALVGWGDYITGPDISFRLFYVLPLFLVTWRSGRQAGILIALLSALTRELIGEESLYTHESAAVLFWNLALEVLFFIVMVALLDAIRRGLEQAQLSSQTDFLTGAANRRRFREVLEREIERARRSHQPLSIAYLDLDNFKLVNDALGHAEGDRVLCVTVREIKAEVRPSDLLGRLGGDEFALLLPETNAVSSENLMSRVRARLLQIFDQNSWPVSVSIGVMTYQELPPTADEVIHQADYLMYAVKKSGKNSLRVETWAASGATVTLVTKK